MEIASKSGVEVKTPLKNEVRPSDLRKTLSSTENLPLVLSAMHSKGIILYDASTALRDLISAGAVKRDVIERVLTCPDPAHSSTDLENSTNLEVSFSCSKCNSPLMTKVFMMQHDCGQIIFGDQFSSNCARCGRSNTPKTLKRLDELGVMYKCESCEEVSPRPKRVFHCREFNHEFTERDAKLSDKFSYVLSQEALKELSGKLGMLIELAHETDPSGAELQIGGSIMGSLGVKYEFDMILSVGGKTVPVDVVYAEEKVVDALISMHTKAESTDSKRAALVVIPSASDAVKNLASEYRITIIEGDEPSSIFGNLKSRFATLFSTE